MEKIKSWDVFDTLIARRYINNDYILKIIQDFQQIPNFFEHRKNADNGARSLLEIYQELARTEVIKREDVIKLAKFEVELEKENIFPIDFNLKQVSDGDLLISDMYLSSAEILQLVRAAGLNSQVSIYQSNNKKRTGEIWDKIKDLDIEMHIGDNIESDIENAKARGIDTRHFIDAIEITGIEKTLFSNGLSFLGTLLREVRLRTLDPDKQIKDILLSQVSGQLNLPWLLIACELLHRKYEEKNLVFLGRDCQLLYKVYNAFYQNCYYLPFSRKVAFKQPIDSVEYIKSNIPPNSVLVDISSTGATWEKICSIHEFDIEILIYSDMFHYSSSKPKLPKTFSFLTKNSEIGQTNEVLEVFNCADHGVLDSIVNHNGVYLSQFGSKEMKESDTQTIHHPIDVAVKIARYYDRNLLQEFKAVSNSVLHEMFAQFLKALCSQNQVIGMMGDYINNQEKYMNQVKQIQRDLK